MSDTRKAISPDDRLRALALYHMAKEAYQKSWAYHQSLCRLLDVENGSHVSDAIYADDGAPTSVAFDEALEREGIAIADGGA